MPDNMSIALYLLVIGMSITFGALLLLWGLMALLTVLTAGHTRDAPAAEAAESVLPAPLMQSGLSEQRRRAAAVAVAVALAREQAVRRMVTATSTVSPWQAAGRVARTGQERRERL